MDWSTSCSKYKYLQTHTCPDYEERPLMDHYEIQTQTKTEMLNHYIPLDEHENRYATLTLPKYLTKAEAQRITDFLMAIAF